MSTETKYQTVWVATVNGSSEHDTPWGAAALAAANYMAGRPNVKTFKDCPAFSLRPEYGPHRSLGSVEAWRFEGYFRSQCSLDAILAARKVLKDRFPYAYRRAILELDRIYIERSGLTEKVSTGPDPRARSSEAPTT